ncbi:sugar transferase [Nocardioides houyundeii]|uniref:sugar transferase n=1 Tax=Nocardioides houyundeii TaxID=2045452 RepID=UPI0013B39208|nr:sugar transferase [Nocardioides houyundeii]
MRQIPLLVLLTDLVLVVSAITFGSLVRDRVTLFGETTEITPHVVGVVLVVLTVAWIGGIALVGGYEPEVFDTGTDEYKRVFRGTLLAAGVIGIGCYLLKYDLSRGFFVIAFSHGFAMLLLGRLYVRRLAYAARRRGHLMHKVLIAGSRAHNDELAASLERERRLGYRVIGAVTPAYDMAERTSGGLSVLGDIEDLAEIAIASGCDVVFVTGGAFDSPFQLKELVWALENHHIHLVVAPSLTDVSGERVRFRPVDGLPLIHVDGPRTHLATRGGKRLFDTITSAVLLVLLSPLFLALALRVRLHDGGAALFKQVRTGRDGTTFHCWKFRTMVVDAEDRLPVLHEQHGHTVGLFKLKDDPRITRPGRWMRRLSVDELPQLVNVLLGDMSLVGPRPPLPSEVRGYEARTHRRLRVRPGMTGLWQVSGRSELSWDEAVRMDLYYVDNWSMVQDLVILARTVGAVIRGRGAS